ncbi:type II toxin-antitoxin system RelE/ParE family toxin [Andreprevotia chitinilytica]|uniref:type II toxin-antitoxin system RelE/ParE family toxin n=1 Tax=Andreprevotia chitinilytica TaxID=396808 RepID=UPI00068E3F1D|nr:type II toxin-antitoxin system RelE/ParE family toxin [Andreprevotia chitinilytica]
MRVVWLRRAINDRDAQLDYIANDNAKAAIEQGDRIADQIGLLAQHPEMGRAGRKQGTRELVINRTPFILVYRLKGDRIELLRLLHGAQQWPSLTTEKEIPHDRT